MISNKKTLIEGKKSRIEQLEEQAKFDHYNWNMPVYSNSASGCTSTALAEEIPLKKYPTVGVRGHE